MHRAAHALIVLVLISTPAIADQWETLDPSTSPSPRYGHSMVTLADGVYLFGGYLSTGATDEMWRWNLETGSWEEVPQSGQWPPARAYHGAVLWEEDMIIMGGSPGTGTDLDDVWRYHPGEGWSVLSPGKILIFPSTWIAVFSVVGLGIFISGGFIQGTILGRLLRIFPLSGFFTFLFLQNDIPQLRRYGQVMMGFWITILLLLSIISTPGKTGPMDYPIYAFGGADLDSFTDDLVRIDPATGDAELVEVTGPKPSARIWPANAGWGATTFLFGGEGEGLTRLADCWTFDAESESFSPITALPMPLSDAAAAVVPMAGSDNTVQVLVFGGLTGLFNAQQTTYLYTSDVAYQQQSTPDAVIAATARAQGLGVFFVSRFSWYNAGDNDLTMELVFTPRGGGAGDQLTADATLAAGAFEEVEDPLATFFGISDDAVGSVLVTVTGGDRASLILHSVIIARQNDGNEYNQFFPATAYEDGLTAGTAASLFTTEDPEHNRVNFGVTALDDGTEVQVTPVKPLGQALADPRTFILDRGGNAQINRIHQAFSLNGMADVMLQMEVISGRATGYVSVLDGTGGDYVGTSDPTTIQPIVIGSESVVLQEIGPVQGLNEFSGSGSLVNFAGENTNVRVDFYRRNQAGVAATATIPVPANTTFGYSDIVSELVGLDNAVGTLVLTSPTGGRIGAIGREYAILRDGGGTVIGTAGQPMPGLTPEDQLQPGQTAHFIGLKQVSGSGGPERSHIAFFNHGQETLNYTVKVFNADNQEGTVTGTLEGQTLVQINNIVLEANPQSDNQPKRLQVNVDRGCYVQVFRVNPSGDPITIPPVIR